MIITFIDEGPEEAKGSNGTNGNLSLKALVDEFQIDTGIEDLASQHDHHLYGTPKK